MRITAATALFIILSPWAIGCGTAPNVPDDGGTPCSASSCPDEAPPESVCLEHLAADILDDGCGVFVAGLAGSGDDANPGTKDKPIFSVQYAIDLARRGRGRVFICSDGFAGNVRLPSGVDLFGGFNCWHWGRADSAKVSTLQVITNSDPLIIVEPASSSDTGAADGVSTIANIRMRSNGPISMLIQSGTVVEILRSEIFASNAWGGRDGEEWPSPNQASAGPDGQYGGHACSAATVPGGAAAVNRCDGGMPSISGKGGDGLPDGAEDGETGSPVPASNPTNTGRGGRADQDNLGCDEGSPGSAGALGTVGATGEGIGRISETGWEGGKAGDGGRGMPGQGGGGGGGQRGGFALCGVATKGGAGGGSGGAGGCGGRGGRGGENGYPTIGIVALHAKVTVRDSLITTLEAGPGGDGGPPEDGGEGGRGAPGGAFGDGMWSCQGANGGTGGPGGYGGPGRGGDSIGIAYLDEDQLMLEGVTYELGPPGKGGTSWDWSDERVMGQDGNKVETLRFPE